MSINAKSKNQILFQNKPRQKVNVPSKTSNNISKAQSSKVVTNVFKGGKIDQCAKNKTKNILKAIDENDKNNQNKKTLEEISEKPLYIEIKNNSKDDSALKENDNERLSKEIIMSNIGMNNESQVSNFSVDTSNQQDKSKNSNTNSLNLENFLINLSLSKKSRIPTDEYREMFSKIVRDDYSNSIINSLLSDEEINENYLSYHKITERMRTRMVDWMIEVLSNYHCDESAFFEAVNLMERYFKICEIKKRTLLPEELHLIGVTSMFIASKYQDIYPLRLRIIHEKIAHKKLSCEEIKNKEEEITKLLNYSIGIPTMWDFINLFVEEIFLIEANHHHITNKTLLENYYEQSNQNNDKGLDIIMNKLYTKNMLNLLNHVCIYLAKMNCHDYTLMQKKPSLLAAGTIYVAIKICEQINKEEYINEYFTSKLNFISQKSENDIIKTAQKILYNAQNFDTLFSGLDNLKKVHFNAIIELKNTK